MRQAVGCSRHVWWVALCALNACSGGLRFPAELPLARESCEATTVPSHAGDSVTFAFVTSGLAREACAMRLVSALLRPWPASRGDRWTVHVAVSDATVIARRLDGAQARDAIDSGNAHVATEDADLIAYAAAHPDLVREPLPWDRAYLAVARHPLERLGRHVLSDAVRADARLARLPQCEPGPSAVTPEARTGRSSRVVYESGDPTARELAERIVAIEGDASSAALGLDPIEFGAALHAGSALAFVVSVRRSHGSDCDAVTALAQRAPWATWPAIVPLVDTRAHAIAPRP